MEKYISKAIPTPARSIRFNIFPTPKYRKKRKSVITEDVITPLLVFTKITENVNVSAEKARKKNKGITPRSSGSVKSISEIKKSHKINVISKVRKKFFLSLTSFFLFSFFINFILP